MEEKGSFGYFLLGLGIGVAAGILWAPRTGEETRQLIADKAGEGADYVRARTEDGKQYVRQQTDALLQQADSLKGSAADLYDKGVSTMNRQKENLNAAVEAGKQAYRDAVSDVKTAAANPPNTGSTTTPA